MALTVGELTAFLGLDTRGLDAGVDRAEREMRGLADTMTDAGDRAGRGLADGLDEGATRVERQLADLRTALVRDADRAGDAAGDALRDGLADGAEEGAQRAENEVSGLRREIVAEAERAGDQAGDALAEGLGDSGGQGAQEAAGGLEAGKGGLAAAGAMVGAAAGAALMAGLMEALDQSRITGRLGAQLGVTAEEAERYGHLAGELYANAVTEDIQGAADAIRVTMTAGLVPPDATNRQIESIATKISDLASTFELDLGQAANAIGQMMKTGLSDSADEALDTITRGLQRMGPRADDIADTFNEYSTIFRNMGMSAEEATGLMVQGLQAGARDTDVVADAIKEFSIEAVAGGDRVKEGFKSLGLSADDMVDKFARGGEGANEALDEVFDRLRKIKDPAERNAVAIELFGTKAEDLGDALWALDPSSAVEALGDVGGAAEEMGDTLRDNAGARVEQLKRSLTQGFVEALGTSIGWLEEWGGKLGDIWDEAGKGADGLPDQIINALEILGEKAWEKIKELGPKLIDAIMEAGQDFADYVTENPQEVLQIAAIGAAIVAALAALPILIGGALIATATAAAWTFVSGMISGLIEKLPEWWDSFTGWLSEKAGEADEALDELGEEIAEWFDGLWDEYVAGPVSRTWNSWVESARELPGRTTEALSDLGSRLKRRASEAWQDFKDAGARKGREIVDWAEGLPGRVSRGIGSLGSLLYGKGQSLVTGLWNGIKSMGRWLRDTLYSWARDSIPGPIARALGIASPSKLMRDEIGRWIPAGVVEGITDGQGEIDAAMASLVDPSLAQLPAWSTAGAAGHGVGSGGAGADGRPLVLQVSIGGREMGELWIDVGRHEVRARGGLRAVFGQAAMA